MKMTSLLCLLVLGWCASGRTFARETCPPDCKCKSNNRYIWCENHSLTNVPKGIPSTAEELYLGKNLITTLGNDSFSTLGNLTTLSLKGNKLIKLEARAFSGLTKLKVLYLTQNELTAIDKEVFRGLDSLEHLYLAQNSLQLIPDVRYARFLKGLNLDTNKLRSPIFPPGFKENVRLEKLVMSNNHFPKVKKSDLEALKNSPIGTLKLSRCFIKFIEGGTFEDFTKLVSLSLSHNELNTSNVQSLMNGLSNSRIVSLDLGSVIISGNIAADAFQALANVPLTTLKLANSSIHVLPSNVFRPLRKLMYLDLSHSEIQMTENESFSGLDKLTSLNLYSNSLEKLPLNFPPNLHRLNLNTNNHIGVLPDKSFLGMGKLKELLLYNCGLHQISSDSFLGLSNLETLDMGRNLLGGTSIPQEAFKSLGNLKKLILNNNKMTAIKTNNPLFSKLKSLSFLDMSSNDCGQLPSDIFTGLGNLSVLHLQENRLGDNASNLNSELFASLSNLKSLHLEHNAIKALPDSLFMGLKSVHNISLSDNLITSWPEGASQFISNMTFLDLSYNQMSTIKATTFSSFQPGFALNLLGNPFDCWCDLRDFRQWINRTSSVVLVDLAHYKCDSPESMAGRPLLSFDPAAIKKRCQPPPWQRILTASICGFAGLVIITAALVYRYRWPLRLRWFHMRIRKRRGQAVQIAGAAYNPLAEEYEYDAYISVCDEDRDWVEEHLLPKMAANHQEEEGADEEERPGTFRLCYDELDIPAGTKKYTAVGDFMLRCQKVILVLSHNYLKSPRHANWDVELAASLTNRRGLHTLILIRLEPDVEAELPTSLRLKLERFEDRLETWRDNDPVIQELFWGKLREHLANQRAVVDVQV